MPPHPGKLTIFGCWHRQREGQRWHSPPPQVLPQQGPDEWLPLTLANSMGLGRRHMTMTSKRMSHTVFSHLVTNWGFSFSTKLPTSSSIMYAVEWNHWNTMATSRARLSVGVFSLGVQRLTWGGQEQTSVRLHQPSFTNLLQVYLKTNFKKRRAGSRWFKIRMLQIIITYPELGPFLEACIDYHSNIL